MYKTLPLIIAVALLVAVGRPADALSAGGGPDNGFLATGAADETAVYSFYLNKMARDADGRFRLMSAGECGATVRFSASAVDDTLEETDPVEKVISLGPGDYNEVVVPFSEFGIPGSETHATVVVFAVRGIYGPCRLSLRYLKRGPDGGTRAEGTIKRLTDKGFGFID